jgi:predicted 2-oxoglutarate/Fe(II)-dependent dioxygenase YbiX
MIYYQDIVFTKTQCEEIKSLGTDFNKAKLKIKKGNEYEDYVNEKKRNNTAAYITIQRGDMVFEMLNKAIRNFGFEFKTDELDTGILKYETGNFIFKHNDLPPEGVKRRFCIVGQLNDNEDYEGGDFLYWIGDEEHKMNRAVGNVIIFNPETLHEVTIVKSGVRHSMVIWVNYEDLISYNKPSLI